jgi:hypothetical protein
MKKSYNDKNYTTKYHRVVVYVQDRHTWKMLKSKLALEGRSISEWFRERIREYLNS